MNFRPLETVPLRARLQYERRRNAFNRRHLDTLARKYSSWSDYEGLPTESASISSMIHPYPGLGHQLASWISGRLWANDLRLSYSGGNVTRDENGLFSLKTERTVPHRGSAKQVRLLSVNDERDPRSLIILRGQVNRALYQAKGSPVHFRLALDQARWDQSPSAAYVRSAVLNGSHGAALRQMESARPYIAIHVRRGDVDRSTMGGATGQSRWVDEGWYVRLLQGLRRNAVLRSMETRLYALGDEQDFPMLRSEGVTVCLNGDRDRDFIELCAAKVLIVAPSSFSFSAGLASKGAIIARHPWWHHVPDTGSWTRANDDGDFSLESLERALHLED